MNSMDLVRTILQDKKYKENSVKKATKFAPTNIALVKYWGKRDLELNLPVTSSLSMSIPDYGTETSISRSKLDTDELFINSVSIDNSHKYFVRLQKYLDLFRPNPEFFFKVQSHSDVPIAAGLASSASGFASVVLALDEFFDWNLHPKDLSVLARLGSGSAARSIFKGFAEWHAGSKENGTDSYAEKLEYDWHGLGFSVVMISKKEKPISSTEAMNQTTATSKLYREWPEIVKADLIKIKRAIEHKDFKTFGEVIESNSLNMHATMLGAWPPISYFLPETMDAMHKIWNYRKQGGHCYFTQDAGPNLKLIYQKEAFSDVQAMFADRLDFVI